jgi:hypothetical protein
LPDSSWYNIPKWGKIYQITIKCTKWPQNIYNGYKTDQMVIKYTSIFHASPSKIYPYLDFMLENIPFTLSKTG